MAASALLSSVALKKVVRPPSTVANTLDWKKATGGAATAMTIDIHSDRIGLALATLRSDNEGEFDMEVHRGSRRPWDREHSRGFSFSCEVLDSIPLIYADSAGGGEKTAPRTEKRKKRKRVMPPDAKLRLSGLVRDHNVCGFVVSWPVQQDTGLMGASCGRTLWALEQLVEEDETESEHSGDSTPIIRPKFGPLFAPNRPLCLWDGVHKEHPSADAFGRSSVYARTSTKTEHCASKEQYHQDDSVLAAEIWRDFCEHHWPAVVRKDDAEPKGVRNLSSNSKAPADPVEPRFGRGSFGAARGSTLVAA